MASKAEKFKSLRSSVSNLADSVQNTPSSMGEQEMRADIESKMGALRQREEEMNTADSSVNTRLDGVKEQLLKNLFEMMKEMGVDPGNLESIKNFLMTLEESDPDLATLFENAFNILSPQQNTEEMNGVSSDLSGFNTANIPTPQADTQVAPQVAPEEELIPGGALPIE